MFRVAICGGIGSGKSAVTAVLRELGAKVVVADEINAELLLDPEYIAEVKNIFPTTVDTSGIKKKELAAIIYRNESEREKLMALAHPRIYQRMLERFKDAALVFYEIPLFSECPLSFDLIWYVSADREERISRIIRRDGMDRKLAERVLSLQAREDLLKKRADVVISNDGDLNALRTAVESKYCSILKRFS